jgi:hypothetical protein
MLCREMGYLFPKGVRYVAFNLFLCRLLVFICTRREFHVAAVAPLLRLCSRVLPPTG